MIELKPAEFSDYTTVATIHAESWKNNYRDILTDKFLDEEVEKNRLEFWFKKLSSPDANQQITLAMNESSFVGFSCLCIDYDPHYGSLLDNLHVVQAYQKSGVGKLLIKHCAKTILEKSISSKMYLWVYEANEKARKVYEHLGGKHLYTVTKFTEDGIEAKVCRYVWENVSSLVLLV